MSLPDPRSPDRHVIECINACTHSKTMSQALLSTSESNLPTFETEHVYIESDIKPEPPVIMTSQKAKLDRQRNRMFGFVTLLPPVSVPEGQLGAEHGQPGILSPTKNARYATGMTDLLREECGFGAHLSKGSARSILCLRRQCGTLRSASSDQDW